MSRPAVGRPGDAPSIALWGTFDVDNYGDQLFPRIARRELLRRLPDARVDAFSPLGWLHPTRFDEDPAVHPLGPWTPARLDGFAARYDAVVVGGGELLHLDDGLLGNFYGVPAAELDVVSPSLWFLEGLGPTREHECPVLWNGVGVPFDLGPSKGARVRRALAGRSDVGVRDARSRRRLLDAGVLGVRVVPDSGILVDRLFAARELDARIDRLRRRGQHPCGRTVVVQGCDLLQPHAAAVADAVGAWGTASGCAPVLLETGRCRGDVEFADAVEHRLGGAPPRPDDLTVADVAAVLRSAAAVVCSSLHAAITALAFRRPFVLMNLGDESKLDGFAEAADVEARVVHDIADLPAALSRLGAGPPPATAAARLQTGADRQFDRLAATIRVAASRRAEPARDRCSRAGGDLLGFDRDAVTAHVAALEEWRRPHP